MKSSSSKNLLLKISLILFGLIFGILIGWFLKGERLNSESYILSNLRESGYKYISPLIDAEPRDMTKRKDLINLEDGLKKIIEEILNDTKKIYNVSHISVYYKEFSSGAWIGINEKAEFSPASLLKVPLMMAFYKIAELDPSYLKKKIEYQSVEVDITQNIVSSKPLINGELYSIEELINRAIVDSDNQAFFSLYRYLKQQDQKKTYLDLGLKFPSETESEDFMSVKDYASFFRVLYNSSYLSKEMSSKALKLLTEVKFDKGLVVGLPKEVVVAHKFGERGYAQNNIKQLHDCGIVYYPKKPYLICVMTRGEKLEDLENVIQELSKYIYKAISS